MIKVNQEFLKSSSINSTKGLLILLIILVHMNNLYPIGFEHTLYTINVSSFLFLPFIFNNDKIYFVNFIKIFKRYYIPYSIFFLLSYIFYIILISHQQEAFPIVIEAWIIGTSYSTREVIGLGLFWFFPALMLLLSLLMIYNSLNKLYKKIMLTLFIGFHFTIGIFTKPNDIFDFAPFNFHIVFYLFILGITVRYFIRNIELKKVYFYISIAIFVITMFISYGDRFNLASPYFPNLFTRPIDFIVRDLMMLSGFLIILYINRYITIFQKIGLYSIAIYTIHPFVSQGLNKVFESPTMILALIKFLLIIFITFGISMVIYKIRLDRYIYPR